MTNLAVFVASVVLIGVGVTAAFGWPPALIVVGGIGASITLLATMKGKK